MNSWLLGASGGRFRHGLAVRYIYIEHVYAVPYIYIYTYIYTKLAQKTPRSAAVQETPTQEGDRFRHGLAVMYIYI